MIGERFSMWRHGLQALRRKSVGEWRTHGPRIRASLSTVASSENASSDEEEFRVFVVAGEPSGDVIGSRLMNSLRRLSPKPLRFAGVGGYSRVSCTETCYRQTLA